MLSMALYLFPLVQAVDAHRFDVMSWLFLSTVTATFNHTWHFLITSCMTGTYFFHTLFQLYNRNCRVMSFDALVGVTDHDQFPSYCNPVVLVSLLMYLLAVQLQNKRRPLAVTNIIGALSMMLYIGTN